MAQSVAHRVKSNSATISSVRGLRVHMIGIGGCGMIGAARVLLERGAIVSGSDLSSFEGLGELTTSGARIGIGHREEQLADGVDLVVASAAVPETNPEMKAARQRGLTVIKYAELVGVLMNGCRGVAIAGTHGKSTTTAMTAFLFKESGLQPSFIVGARSEQLGGSSGAGSGPHFIVESCEFDRSFLNFHPHTAAFLNIEPDHLDCYRDLSDIIDAFGEFGAQVARDGLLVCNGEDAAVREASRRAVAPIETFGFGDGVDWRATNLRVDRGRFAFDVIFQSTRLFATELTIPGKHNVANALAAIALAHHAGVSPREMAELLPLYSGVSRRMTYRGNGGGVTIVDDYAHHPTEIRVTIDAVRRRYEPKRMWVVFQPHQQSRTRHFMDDFAASFGEADEIIVPDIYGARETDELDRQVGAQELVSRIQRRGGRATYFASLDAITEHVAKCVTDGDMVLTMGAGDVWKVADGLVERIC